MKFVSAVTLLALFLMGSGCELIGSTTDNGDTKPLTALPRDLTASEHALIQGSNSFAFGFLREVDAIEDDPNVFLSPLSASMALGMTMNGAAGETQSEMRETLGFEGMSLEEINTSYRNLIDLLVDLDETVEMRIANALWMREGFDFREPFLAATQDYFDAEARALDFADPASVDVINQWVEESTNGRIDSILDEIAQDAVLYLMNAIYFKGTWTTQFDPDDTSRAPFTPVEGAPYDVDMMHASAVPVSYAFLDDVAVLDLPYGRDAFSMTIVLPSEDRTLAELVASTNEEQWNEWLGALQEGELDVFLPRFRLEYERTLKEALESLGMQQAFDPARADFSPMSDARDDLYIHEVKQKSFLDVNEEGTEAAAVTSVEIRVTSAPPSFRVDRPFLMVIRERFSGSILFIGAIGAPESVD